MEITKELETFINTVADIAMSQPDPCVTREECIAEYADQIRNEDYGCVVIYAQDMGIEIPEELQWVLEPDKGGVKSENRKKSIQ